MMMLNFALVWVQKLEPLFDLYTCPYNYSLKYCTTIGSTYQHFIRSIKSLYARESSCVLACHLCIDGLMSKLQFVGNLTIGHVVADFTIIALVSKSYQEERLWKEIQ